MADRTPADPAHPRPLTLVSLSDQDQPAARIPAPLTSFVGREQELAAVTALLRRPNVRLLTLTGPGGIGKTRLALQVADGLSEEFTDGTAIVSLAPVRDPVLVLPTMAQSLNVPDPTGQFLLGRVQASLAERHLLLVLDNLEHLLDAVAPLIADLLVVCPALSVLATSRFRLNISGEQVVPVAPLDQGTARVLFTVRAEATEPEFAVASETVPVIDAICDRLDRLPLAIELAAARVSVLPPRALLARLDHRLDLLTGGPRDAPDRQRDMRAAIDWSHDLLTEPEQVVFRRLGVFVGGFTLEAAGAVAGEGMDVLTGVSALVAASLVFRSDQRDGQPRFGMLETIREYALVQLTASGEEPLIREAQARHFLTLAEEADARLTGPDEATWLARLEIEHDNLRGSLAWFVRREDACRALRLAGALWWFWFLHGHAGEGRRWLDQALALDGGTEDARTRALYAAGVLAAHQSDLAQADELLAIAIPRLRQSGDQSRLVYALNHQANVALSLGDLQRAETLCEEAVRLATEIGDRALIAHPTMNLGRVAAARGDHGRAEALMREALTGLESAGPWERAVGTLFLGRVVRERGDRTRALALYGEVLPVFASLDDRATLARCLEGVADAAVGDRPETCARLLGAAAALRERAGRPVDLEDRPAYERTLAAIRTRLGSAASAAAIEMGRAAPLATIVDEALTLAHTLPSAERSVSQPERLSPRELEVLHLIAAGHANADIAARLSISPRTVTTHATHILNKLGLATRAELIAFAHRHGLV